MIRVAENYDPRTTKFDVVIIDEASQCDVTGLMALYFGKQVVVVGDDEQVSPEAVGQRIDETQRLINEFLYGIPNDQLYDGKSSIWQELGLSFILHQKAAAQPIIVPRGGRATSIRVELRRVPTGHFNRITFSRSNVEMS